MKLFMKRKLENSDLDANLLGSITFELQAKNNELSNFIRRKKIKFSSVRIKIFNKNFIRNRLTYKK